MKNPLLKFNIYLLAASLCFGACKKKNDAVPNDDTSQETADVSDETGVTLESESSVNDANAVFSSVNNGNDRVSAGGIINGATIDSSMISVHKIVINYDGKTPVSKRVRSGSLTVELTKGGHWKDSGSVIMLTYNYKVTWANGKTWSLTGTKTIKNVSGGLIKNLSQNLSIVHQIHGNVNILFDDNTSRTWYFARTRTYTLSSGVLTESMTGDTTVNGIANIDKGGTNRRGINFYVQIESPIVWSSQCDELISGVKLHKGVEREVTVTYGVDNSGNPVNSCSAYGYKFNWINLAGESKQAVVNY